VTVVKIANQRTDWVGALAFLFGAAVVVPSLAALLIALFAVVRALV
jgi:hypothetical protein